MADDAKAPVPRHARDLPSLQAGQRVLVARDGGVVSPRANRNRRIAGIASALGMSAIAIALNPLVGGAVVAATSAWAGQNLRWSRRANAALRLAVADKVDEAERALDALGRPIVQRGRRLAHVALIRSLIAERRGNLDEAVRCADTCVERLPAPRRPYTLVYWQNQFNRCGWMIELGRVEPVRAQLARCGQAPGGEWYKLGYRSMVMRAALIGAAEPPSDETLDAWLRDGLRYNHTGTQLALIGHALEQRGDADSAAHAYAEAGSRFLGGDAAVAKIARIYPKLWAVIGPKIEAARAAAVTADATAD